MPERVKKPRGNYAKLICLQCRDRRIKCLLPEQGSVEPSDQPQPAASSCQRCRRKGLQCIVRKTTLGRPNRKWQEPATTPSPVLADGALSRSPSPHVDDLVLVNPDHDAGTVVETDHHAFRRQSNTNDGRSTGHLLAEAMDKTLDRALALLGQDRHFGQALLDLGSQKPINILNVIDESLTATLDSRLVWVRLSLPWIPSLTVIRQSIADGSLDASTTVSTTALLALLYDIALDASFDPPASSKQVRDNLRVIIYHFGRRMLFELPKHESTMLALELIHKYRPLSLISDRQAATHALTGKLYTTLEKTIAQQLGLHYAPTRLKEVVEGRNPGDVRPLIYQTLHWCGCLMSEPLSHGEFRSADPATYDAENVVEHALKLVSDCLESGMAPRDALLPFYVLRNDADDLYVMRCMTRDWDNLEGLRKHIHNREILHTKRLEHFEHCLQELYYKQSHLVEAEALSQLSNLPLNVGRANIIALGLFYAITCGTQTSGSKNLRPEPTGPFSQFFLERLTELSAYKDTSPVANFLEQFGDPWIDMLEKKLASFISVANNVKLKGLTFAGPPRRICCNMVFACKELVENNAVRLRLGEGLHDRIDVHLVLFMEAARCLECMEARGGTAEAMARGSVPTACAKLIRSFHRIILQWKRNKLDKDQIRPRDTHPHGIPTPMEPYAQWHSAPAIDLDTVFNDDFFSDWENWPQIGSVDGSGLLDNDLGLGMQ